MSTATKPKKRTVTTVSLPGELYQAIGRLAAKQGLTRSELIREALVRYRRQDGDWETLLDEAREAALKADIRTEDDVERVIDEIRA